MPSEPEEVVDAATRSKGTKPIQELEALADCPRIGSVEEPEVATVSAGAIIEGTALLPSEPEEVVDAATGSRGTKPIRELEALADC